MHRTPADRVAALRWFISLSEELFKLNDISSSLGVQGGLESTEVNRLSHTWKVCDACCYSHWNINKQNDVGYRGNMEYTVETTDEHVTIG